MQYFIIDFDSTFVKLEALDCLAEIALSSNRQKDKISKQVQNITNLGMTGKISFDESLRRRLALFAATKEDVMKVTKLLQENITESVLANKEFFKKYAKHIYIISGGFEDYIYPVVKEFGILKKNILANKFLYDKYKNIIGFDDSRLLSKKDGKVLAVQDLQLDGKITVIGDGYTDLQIRQTGAAQCFFSFEENIVRPIITEQADHKAKDFSDFIVNYELLNKIKL